MANPLIPNVAGPVLPPILFKDRMDLCPSQLRIPEPEGCKWRSGDRPLFDMRLIPLGKANRGWVVAWETSNAVGPIRQNHYGRGPSRVELKRIAMEDRGGF